MTGDRPRLTGAPRAGGNPPGGEFWTLRVALYVTLVVGLLCLTAAIVHTIWTVEVMTGGPYLLAIALGATMTPVSLAALAILAALRRH